MTSFNDIIQKATVHKWSDVHFKHGTGIFYRWRGRILKASEFDVAPDDVGQLILATLSDDQKARLERDRKVDYSMHPLPSTRLRGNAFFQRDRLAAAYRLIPSKVPTVAELGLPKACREMALRPRGLVLIAGPGGSGKTTSAAALVQEVNKSVRRHIVSIEDPIEFIFKDDKSVITQREIGTSAVSFHMGLKAALRQDPDVVFIGEMRDLETFSTAITMAETGHLVISTVQAIGACEVIDRVVNMFDAAQQEQVRTQLSLNLQGVLSQLLLPMGDESDQMIAAVEVLVPTTAIRALIRKGEVVKLKGTMETSVRDGCVPMKHAIEEMAKKRQITEAIKDKALHYVH